MERSKNKLGILSLQFYCYPDEIGGAWKLTYEVNKRLVDRGHQVYLITCKPTPDLPDYEVIDGIHYYRVDVRQSKSFIGLWRGLRKRVNTILGKHPIHLVHIHNPLVEFAALMNPRFWPVPKIYHFHSLWYNEEKINRCGEPDPRNPGSLAFCFKLRMVLNIIRMIEWTCFYTARSILFLSRYSQGRFLEFYPLKKPRLKVIPGGVDVKAFRPMVSGLSPSECRRRLGLPLEEPLFLTVRRLEARMGLGNLVSACALLAGRNPNLMFRLVIAGKGTLFDQLNSQIKEHNLQDRVRLVGLVSTEELPLYYGAADVFVLPSTSIEGFGLATAEALASGLPVLGTPIGGTVEILEAIDSKLLFADTTAEAIAAGLETFLKDPRPFVALKNRCREEAVNKYGWDQVVDNLEEEFYRAIDGDKD